MHYEKERSLKTLMEKLRLKAGQYKSWNENAKFMRTALMDKRQMIDSAERETLQKCLDSLQKSIKVTTLQSMVERLESITRQQGLMFTAGPSGADIFISCDLFYLEVLMDNTGNVKDVKIYHQGEPDPISCSLLADILRKGEFKEFTNHLEGLASIYQLNADKKQKCKAYLALKALETDLKMLSELQSSINEPNNLIHRSPVGILQDRVGGKAMKLTFFISPYDLLDVEAKQSIPLTVEAVKGKKLGHSVTVGIESSTAHKLQTMSLMTISKSEGKSLPQFAALSNLNSTTLPASFALQLPHPTPICVNLLKKIQTVTGITCGDLSKTQPMLSLISQQASNGQLSCNNNKGMFVTLPDQHHCYFMNTGNDLKGVLVSSIPFVHPTHVPQILVFLRQQTLFNELIGSCIRTCSKQDLQNALTFEVIALSWLHISISFEHPSDESMATADLDLSDVTNSKCKLYSLSTDNNICSDEYASKVLQRCLSIPIMMRAIIKKAQAMQKKNATSGTDPFYNAVSAGMNSSTRQRLFGSANGSNDCINDKFSFNGSNDGKNGGKMTDDLEYECRSVDSSNNLYSQSNTSLPAYKSTDLLSPSSPTHSLSQTSTVTTSESPTAFDNSKVTNNNNTVNTAPKLEPKSGGMLMNMLHDTAQNQPVTMLLPKIRKQRKRKNNDGNPIKSPIGRSPKRKFSEDDLRDMRTPTPSSTPDHNMSSGSASPAGPYDTSSTFFPIKSSPSVESPTFTNRLASPLETVVKMEQPEPSPVRRSVSVDLGQVSEAPAKYNENSNPDLFTGQSNKDHYEFTSADGAEPNFSGYRSENNGTETDTPISVSLPSRATEKPKEKKVKKIKLESSETKLSSTMDIQCLVAEQVAKLHGDSISPPPPPAASAQTSTSSSSGSTSIKISTKDGVKISTKVSGVKKQGKRSSSAGIDTESRRKSEAKKEKKRKRAESADALEHKTSIKLMPLPSGTRVNQSSEKKTGDIARSSSHGVKPSNSTGGSGSSSQSKMSLTTTIKKSPSHSSSTTSPKNVSILKHSQSNKNQVKSGTNRQLTSPKSSGGGGDGVSKSLSSKSLKFHSSNKTEKHSSEKMKLKQLNIPSSTTITTIGNKMNQQPSTTQTLTIVQSSAAVDALKSSTCFAITTPPSMSITPVNVSSSPPSPTESGKKNSSANSPSMTNTWSGTGNGNNNGSNNKSPLKPRKNSLSAVIDKLMVNAGGVTIPSSEQGKNETVEKKADKKESNKSVDSRKYNAESKSSDNKAEFTVKQSSQGIKLTVTKTRTDKVSKNKTGSKSGSWTSSNSSSPSKPTGTKQSLSGSSFSTNTPSSAQISSSKKHFSSSSGNSSKIVPKSSSSSLKITVASTASTTKVTASTTKSNVSRSTTDIKMINANDLKQKFEDKLKVPKSESKDRKDKAESESEKAFQLLLAQSKSSTSYITNSFMSTESASFVPAIPSTESLSSISKNIPIQPPEESKIESLLQKSQAVTGYSLTEVPMSLTKSADCTSATDANRPVSSSPKVNEASISLPKLHEVGMDLTKPSSQTPPPPPQSLVKPKKKISSTPKSDDDDGEDELVIDCPGTPRKHKVSFEDNSASTDESNPSNNPESKIRAENKFSPPQPSPGPIKSPINVSTPHSEVLSNPSSVSRPSPCVIDDDLMDEALMLGK